MSATKNFIFEAAELAFTLEINQPNRPAALKAWNAFTEESKAKYGEDVQEWITDIFDDIADRSGEYWDFFADDSTFEELRELYSRSAA